MPGHIWSWIAAESFHSLQSMALPATSAPSLLLPASCSSDAHAPVHGGYTKFSPNTNLRRARRKEKGECIDFSLDMLLCFFRAGHLWNVPTRQKGLVSERVTCGKVTGQGTVVLGVGQCMPASEQSIWCDGRKLSPVGVFIDFLLPWLPRASYHHLLSTGAHPYPHQCRIRAGWGTVPAGGGRRGLGREKVTRKRNLKGWLEDLVIREKAEG